VDEPRGVGKLEKSRRDLLTGPMDDHLYYLRQKLNTFPVVPVSTLSAPIASSRLILSVVSFPQWLTQPGNRDSVSYTSTSDELFNGVNIDGLECP